MKKIFIFLLLGLSCSSVLSIPSSTNYTLRQNCFSSGVLLENKPYSANYILAGSAVAVVAGDIMNSVNHRMKPGYYLGPLFSNLLSPENVLITIIGSDVHITWELVYGATSYKMYSSNDPYLDFSEDHTGMFFGTSWVTDIQNMKKYYFVTAISY